MKLELLQMALVVASGMVASEILRQVAAFHDTRGWKSWVWTGALILLVHLGILIGRYVK